MLEKIDLTKKLEKDDYKYVIDLLEIKIGKLQRKAKELNIPIIFVFEGWDAAGKGTLINKLSLTMDPRGFAVQAISSPNEEERLRPPLWRFWNKTPGKGKIAIFDRSWYGRVLVERVNKIVERKTWEAAYEEIQSFERQLVDDGAIISKFFLHIDKKEQKKRFIKIEKNPSTAWKVTKEDWKNHKNYDKYSEAIEDMLSQTDTDFAPWTIIEAHDKRFATAKVFKTVIDTIEKKIWDIENKPKPAKKTRVSSVELNHMSSSILDKVGLTQSLEKEEYKEQLKKYQTRIHELEHEAYHKRLPVIITYEGWDAAGKGGNIKRLVQAMDPRGYEVIPVAAPNDIERAHHYLWRFWNAVPKAGHIAIFDRTWYGRVLVERVEGFCKESDWKRAYKEINEMEKQFTSFGSVLVKFWVHISKEEQLRRFEEREKTEYKQWKITDEDWRNREKWDDYKCAIDEMLYRTSTPYAPWTIVESNCKWFARIKVLKTVIKAIEEKL